MLGSFFYRKLKTNDDGSRDSAEQWVYDTFITLIRSYLFDDGGACLRPKQRKILYLLTQSLQIINVHILLFIKY